MNLKIALVTRNSQKSLRCIHKYIEKKIIKKYVYYTYAPCQLERLVQNEMKFTMKYEKKYIKIFVIFILTRSKKDTLSTGTQHRAE